MAQDLVARQKDFGFACLGRDPRGVSETLPAPPGTPTGDAGFGPASPSFGPISCVELVDLGGPSLDAAKRAGAVCRGRQLKLIDNSLRDRARQFVVDER